MRDLTDHLITTIMEFESTYGRSFNPHHDAISVPPLWDWEVRLSINERLWAIQPVRFVMNPVQVEPFIILSGLSYNPSLSGTSVHVVPDPPIKRRIKI